MSEEPSFTISQHKNGKDFLLHTGIAAHRLDEDIIGNIKKCNGEYSVSEKAFVISPNSLCDLLDECFDYFTEESLLAISALIDNNTETDSSVKERVREKSVSKAKRPKDKVKEEPHRSKEDRQKEDRQKDDRQKDDRQKEERQKEERQKEERQKEERQKEERQKEEQELKVRRDEKLRETERKNKELEDKLLTLERQREEDKRAAIRAEDLRKEELKRQVSKQDDPILRLKASPQRSRIPDLYSKKVVFEPKIDLRGRKEDFHPRYEERVRHRADEGLSMMGAMNSMRPQMNDIRSEERVRPRHDDDTRKEVLSMMSSLRSSMSEIKTNMSRLEQLISRHL